MNGFEIGDIVVSLKSQTNFTSDPLRRGRVIRKNFIAQVAGKNKEGIWFQIDGSGFYDYKKFRLATDEEKLIFKSQGAIELLDRHYSKKSKFKEGDIVNIDGSGYQYSDVSDDVSWKQVVNCNVRTRSGIKRKILKRHHHPIQLRWWYLVEGYGNWITEDCISLYKDTSQVKTTAAHKFKPEDIVIGNHKASIYAVTKSGWKGRVIETSESMIVVESLNDPSHVYNVDPDHFDLVEEKKEDLSLKENSSKPKYVRLLVSQFGYFQGDVAIVIENYMTGNKLVHVPGRISTSGHAPHVWYNQKEMVPATELEFDLNQKAIAYSINNSQSTLNTPLHTTTYKVEKNLVFNVEQTSGLSHQEPVILKSKNKKPKLIIV